MGTGGGAAMGVGALGRSTDARLGAGVGAAGAGGTLSCRGMRVELIKTLQHLKWQVQTPARTSFAAGCRRSPGGSVQGWGQV